MERFLDKAEKIFDHGIKLEKDLEELKSEFRVLKRRKIDIDSRIDTEVRHGQKVKKEVRGWLKDFKKIKKDVKDVKKRVRSGVPLYERVSLDKLVREKIEMVKKIYDRGNFSEGLVIERAPARGIIIPTEKIEGGNSTKDEIQKHLMDDKVGMIGVCGIGGVGKTTIMKHINNDLLREGRFQKVIWVTVSYPLNIFEVQKKIALAMYRTLPEDKENMIRAAALTEIMERERFVLILDDVWEKFFLEDVGIPKPTLQNGCKVVITSRSDEVCNYLRCKIVEVQPLSPEESLNLFLDTVGREVLEVGGLKEILNFIVKECDGLPLAIIVIAGSMRGINDIEEWRTMLDDLQQCVESVEGMEDKVFARLKLSYDRLTKLEIQLCFLYCSLFREDYEFSRKELTEGWIDEGLIDESGSRKKAYDKGHHFSKRLERNYLLEKLVKLHDVFKMHDVVRDMAIKSIGPKVRYMVKAGMKLKKVPNEHDWAINLNKVSLMANCISEIPTGFTPKCPLLSTLLLSDNPSLSEIPSSFFEDMVGLKVLDLSVTSIEALPNSISDLMNLSALRLRKCQRLKCLPSLAKLRALKKLDLHKAGIEVVPEGLEMLVSLEYLDLFCLNLERIPTGGLLSLSSLQYLVIYPSSAITERINLEEVARLSKLEDLECAMGGIQDFNYLVNKSKDFESLTAYNLRLTTGKQGIPNYGFLDQYQRMVLIFECEIGEECIVLPDKLEELRIYRCKNMKNVRCSLNKAILLEDATELRKCFIGDSKGIECMVELDSSSSCCPVLDELKDLSIRNSPNLSALVRVEGVVTPPHIFSNLKCLNIRTCSGMRKLLPFELLHALQNLEQISIGECEQMEEIIASSDSNASSDIFTFPKLRELELEYLPQLKSICSGKGVSDSIEKITIHHCPKLKKIPLQFPLLDNGQLAPPPHLKVINIDEQESKWWESVEWDVVEWDHHNAQNILQPFLNLL